MDGRLDEVEERHFSGFNTRMVVEYLTAQVGAQNRDAVLFEAGETRPIEVLLDDSTWSSYTQVRRLFEAIAERYGIESLRSAAPTASNFEGAAAEAAAAMQALGSPAALLEESAASGTGMGGSSVLVAVGGERLGTSEYRVRQRFADGFAPFPEWCAFFQGLLSIVPMLFGLAQGEVSEEECQCRGDAACTIILRWEDADDIASKLEEQRAKIHLLELQLSSLRATVADLISPADISDTLTAVSASAARVLRVPTHILALTDGDIARPLIAVGLDPSSAEQILNTTDADSGEPPQEGLGSLSVPIASSRHNYGRLILAEPGRRFRPHEREALLSYASLAAAALDSASAIVEAQRQATTATALLSLSTSLAEIGNTDEIAARLARAVPEVVDCDRAAVLLVDDSTDTVRVAATHGYSAEAARRLLTIDVPHDSIRSLGTAVRLTRLDQDVPGLKHPELLFETGSLVAASVPILADRRIAGYVVAIVVDRPERLAVTVDLEQRLHGLAAQGSAAINNARLLDEIHHQALHDTLTGLPNRALILDRMDQMLRRGRRDKSSVAILFVDLDGFKDVNDTFGHEAGDRLLQEMGTRLLRSIRERDSVGRLGGDEFVVLVETLGSGISAESVAERILKSMREPFVINAKTSVTVTASIGVATGDRLTPSDLLRDADIALYAAKAAGKHQAMVFQPEMGIAATERLELEMDLQAAVAKHQFFLLYQPVVDLVTERIIGVEALLRWLHPTKGTVIPDDFIPLLEQTGLIVPVGAWVLEQACKQAAAWTSSGHRLTMSINLSPRQLESDDLVRQVRSALRHAGLAADQLVLEITETSVMNNVAAAATRLSRLKQLGVRVAIDDFGTGYSSLAYLPNLPVDILKIDRSFVSALGQPGEVGSLVKMLVQLGKSLNLCTVAEGIEEETQLRHLQTEHCDSGQGFLFAHPLEPSALEALLAQADAVSAFVSPEDVHTPVTSLP